MEKFSIQGIDHPAVAADHVEKLATWYCEVLGYEILFKDPRPIWLLRAPDGSVLEILPTDTNPRPSRTNLTPGWSHLAFKVENIEAAIRHLDHHQVEWSSKLSPATGGGKVRTFFDPEGNVLQVVERNKD